MRRRLDLSEAAAARPAPWWRNYVNDAVHGPLPALFKPPEAGRFLA